MNFSKRLPVFTRLLCISIVLLSGTNIVAQTDGLKINELMSNNVSFVMDESSNYSMWVELYNSGTTSVNLQDYRFSDTYQNLQKWQPASQTVGAGGFATLWFERDELAGHSNFKLDPDGGRLLLSKNGQVVDSVVYPPQYRNASYGRQTDGSNTWTTFVTPSCALKADASQVITPIVENSTWSYLFDGSGEPSGWKNISFSESGWQKNQQAPLGYGNSDVATEIGYRCIGYQTAYFRKTISLSNVANIGDCLISARIDDAAVFYVNGTEVGRYNMPDGTPTYNTGAITAVGDPSSVSCIVPSSLLVNGSNVVAVEVHQSQDLCSSDLFFSMTFSHNNPAYGNPASNSKGVVSAGVCSNYAFSTSPGFYSGPISVSIDTPTSGEIVRYTTDGSVPTASSPAYTAPINISHTTTIRTATFATNKITNTITTGTFFINERNFNLPVVSISTDDKNLNDQQIGIFVETGKDWSRPANFEIFDTNGDQQLTQELDIAVSGGYTRSFPLKSLKIQPRNKFGDKRLRYDFFESKKGSKYRDIQIRNSGNDFNYSMFRDGFMQTLVIGRMNIDYQAYQPAVLFLNGQYKGIENLRERTNKDYVYTNYDLEEDELIICDSENYGQNQTYQNFLSFLQNNDPATQSVYQQAETLIDADSYMDYIIAQTYYSNTDWPWNNYKMWRPTAEGGRWRWILFDLDFGFGRGGTNREDGKEGDYYHNTVEYVMNSGDHIIIPLQRLIRNAGFKKKFLSKFCVNLSTTFATPRVDAIMDSLSSKISNEIVYHKNLYGNDHSFAGELEIMKTFSQQRPSYLFNFLKNYFYPSSSLVNINLNANIDSAIFSFNDVDFPENPATIKYFSGQPITVKAREIQGWKFDHWTVANGGTTELTLIPTEDMWYYWDSNGIPSSTWMAENFNHSSWKQGRAMLGYGGASFNTTIEYGSDSNNKYPTAYFRKSFTVSNLTDLSNIVATVSFDDGVAVYVNGTEIGRHNLASGALSFNTYSSGKVNYTGETTTFTVPKSLLHDGENVIAAEVHQCDGTSSDLVFDLSLACTKSSSSSEQTVDTQEYTFNGSNISLTAYYEKDFSGIEDVLQKESKTIKSIRYYDVMGRPVDKNTKGIIIIKQTIFEDGKSVSEKIIEGK